MKIILKMSHRGHKLSEKQERSLRDLILSLISEKKNSSELNKEKCKSQLKEWLKSENINFSALKTLMIFNYFWQCIYDNNKFEILFKAFN